MKPAGELVYNAETTVIPYSSMNLIYGSSDRDEAMILETLILMKRDRDGVATGQRRYHRIWHRKTGSARSLPPLP